VVLVPDIEDTLLLEVIPDICLTICLAL
jgi:hypothetical protein